MCPQLASEKQDFKVERPLGFGEVSLKGDMEAGSGFLKRLFSYGRAFAEMVVSKEITL